MSTDDPELAAYLERVRASEEAAGLSEEFRIGFDVSAYERRLGEEWTERERLKRLQYEAELRVYFATLSPEEEAVARQDVADGILWREEYERERSRENRTEEAADIAREARYDAFMDFDATLEQQRERHALFFREEEEELTQAVGVPAAMDREPFTIPGIEEHSIQNRIELEVERIKIRTEAERRVNAELYEGIGGLVAWDDLESMTTTAMLVDGLLTRDGDALLVGKRNAGKSLFAFGLGFSVAAGVDFLGKATEAGRVMFVLGEGVAGFRKRLTSWAALNGVEPDDLRERVAVYSGGNISNDSSLSDLKRTADAFGASLVIFDTYSSLSGVPDEDKAAVNAEAIRRLTSIAPDAATLTLHHPTKASEDSDAPIARGSGTLTANVDTVITLYRDHKHAVQSMPRQQWLAVSTEDAHQGKQRDAERMTLTGLRILSDEEGAVLTRHDAATHSRSDQWVSAHVGVGEVVTVPGLVASLGQARNTIRGHLRNSKLTAEYGNDASGAMRYIRGF